MRFPWPGIPGRHSGFQNRPTNLLPAVIIIKSIHSEWSTGMTNNFHPGRSCNVYVVFEPGWFINNLDGLSVAVVHGSPWPYDTFVPIIFAGHNIKPQTVSRRVHTIDVASTLANIVGAKPPSGASGEVLLEVPGH